MAYGTPLDPKNAPPKRPAPTPAPAKVGSPVDVPIPTKPERAPPRPFQPAQPIEVQPPAKPERAPSRPPTHGQPIEVQPPAKPERAPGRTPTHGQPVDVPPPAKPPAPPERRPLVGTPVEMPPPQPKPVTIRSVALGFTTGAEAPQLPPGMSSQGSNFISVQGGLSPRPGLLHFPKTSGSATSALLATTGAGVGWVGDYYDGSNNRYPVVLGNPPLWYSRGSWSTLSQTGPVGLSGNTLSEATLWYDATVYYHPTTDQNELCFVASGSGNTAYTTAPGSDPYSKGADDLFSTLTGAPQASYVATFDNRLLFANGRDITWSARGAPETYTSPDGGTESLMDAEGQITRLVPEADRVLVFFQHEVWEGRKTAFPFNFQFTALDRNIGTRFPWSVTQTPMGVVFLGSDLHVYVIPRGGTPHSIGKNVSRLLRDTVVTSQVTANFVQGVYDEVTNGYLLTYQTVGAGQQGLFVSLEDGSWNPLGFDASAFTIRRLGATSVQSLQASTNPGPSRTMVADGNRNVMEYTSLCTSDASTAINCKYFALVPNPNPTERQIVREVRLDYRATSASSLSLRMSPDFGVTYPVNTVMALPAAPVSQQTQAGVGMSAVYPGIEIQHASGHTFTIQGVAAIVESGGNG